MFAKQLFVVPELAGRSTGGTLYNRRLLAALAALGEPALVCDDASAERLFDSARFDLVWVDSLYLHAAPALREQLAGRARLGLLLHYLPSLVALGAVTRETLSAGECVALGAADYVLATSEFMRETVRGLGLTRRTPLCVEPGCELVACGERPSPHDGVRAVLLAHVVEGKGIEPLLSALAGELRDEDLFSLRIIGDTAAEPAYAERCRALIRGQRALSTRVVLCGARRETEVASELAASNLLLSASFMESYGMALAEARQAGLCLIACDAGNVRAHVLVAAGGELVSDASSVARASVRLCRDPGEHARRLEAARLHVPAPRPWRLAALELLAQLRPEGACAAG